MDQNTIAIAASACAVGCAGITFYAAAKLRQLRKALSEAIASAIDARERAALAEKHKRMLREVVQESERERRAAEAIRDATMIDATAWRDWQDKVKAGQAKGRATLAAHRAAKATA